MTFRCDTLEKLRNKLPSLEKEIQDGNRFKDFYQFTFNYAKNPGQKGLDLDMALAYWNIVLKGRFRFLDIWNQFLKVRTVLSTTLPRSKVDSENSELGHGTENNVSLCKIIKFIFEK